MDLELSLQGMQLIESEVVAILGRYGVCRTERGARRAV